MKTPHNFAINTVWGHTDHKTSALHRNTKQVKPIETSLFNILPTDILTNIDIWASGLKHCYKFKAAVKNMDTFSKPTLCSIPPEL